MRTSKVVGFAAALVAFVNCNAVYAASTYYADEGLTYNTSANCGGGTLPNLVSDLDLMIGQMNSDGWFGLYFTDGSAWPQDFRESCSTAYGAGGLDSTYADSAAVSIYSGHGGSSFCEFSIAHNGVCDHVLGSNGRLGSMAGAHSVVGIYSACDVLDISSLAGGGNWQWERENLGFHGLVGNGLDYQYDLAYSFSDEESTAQGWLDAFSGRLGLTDPEPGIAVAYGSSTSDCWNTYDTLAMRGNALMTPRPGGPGCGASQPAFTYCYGTVN